MARRSDECSTPSPLTLALVAVRNTQRGHNSAAPTSARRTSTWSGLGAFLAYPKPWQRPLITRWPSAIQIRHWNQCFAHIAVTVGQPGVIRRSAARWFDVPPIKMSVLQLQLLVHPSMGIAICPQRGACADKLLGCANAALVLSTTQRLRFFFPRHRRWITADQKSGPAKSYPPMGTVTYRRPCMNVGKYQ